ncbi:MAG TPA: endolytic transglycosylase MltG [Cytophagaceae bacterium]|jgi:UPF0755 protein|nr:endolytic transglycosylase MltG [Cytophagaceae bacterium]
MASAKSNGLLLKTILVGIVLLILYLGYKISIGSNMKISADTYYFFVPETASPQTVADSLKNRGFIKSRWSFKIMNSIKGVEEIKPGMYELKNGWSNLDLINHFKIHKPKPTVFITLPALQSRSGVVSAVCKGTDIHPDDVWLLLNDKKFTKELGGFNKESVFCIFIPRNYRIYKSSSAKDLLERLYQEYLLFWNADRLEQAQDMGLKPSEVSTLSSIVYSETKQEDEMPVIAGVYLNRIRINMRLESDPTLVYATRKFGTKRVLFKDKNINSPYNTYKNKGLPPGPIYIVPSWVIDKVLEFDGHDYLYFCANHDLSGGHLFAETYEEHKENAQRYHEKLNKENIY